ncbi:Uncharacterised protein [Mycobacteroides abscessus subsp. massiliense]|uniref:Uncharacterized protein n=1 Tax=Mycobacteroides abscessus subsp. massiliense TaxID=1962118 RepID=A0A1T8GUA5_9MYCO|nr:Uncharacterised protein [Mycobacteroides abscessus subsp. massiliense]SKS56357.1 Uncharacterised protein [Mycobacteroides abscessus subsp. massiliense]SKT51473.1 Uncharacterised protein [Mycobacteroides abscessus subsp. massiliense]SKX00450.1 Uncharacterised protein [Mycobacteroides abscessus subsp. massiliense]
MMEFARGGPIAGPDPTPIYTETMRRSANWGGYVIPAGAVSEAAVRLMARLDETVTQITGNVTV